MNTTHRLLQTLESTQDPRMLQLLARDPQIQSELGVRVSEVSRTGVQCPVIQEEVVVPCALKACAFYTDLARCHHCSLVYAQNTDVQVEDLAILYRKPLHEMQVMVDGVIAKLKQDMNSEIRVEFIPLAGVCCACESPVEENEVSVDGYTYCSLACTQAVPTSALRSGYIAVDLPRS